MHIQVGMCLYNNLDLTKKAVKSILDNTNFNTYSLTFVDDCSTDGTKEYLQELNNKLSGGVCIITNDVNLGYLKSANKILNNQRESYYGTVLINNDTQVTSGWLSKLVSNDSDIVGCRIRGVDGRTHHEAVRVIDGKTVHGNFKDCDYINGSCFFIKTTTLNKIGVFDEIFCPAYHEETDLCLRAKSMGLKVGYESTCEILHKVNASYGKVPQINQIYNKSWNTLKERWCIKN